MARPAPETHKCTGSVCGCGQTLPKWSRNRLVRCTDCKATARMSRGEMANGLHPCRCGGLLEPVCLEDRLAVPGGYGEDAYREYAARSAIREVHAENGRKGGTARGQMVRAQAKQRRANVAAGREPAWAF